MTLLEVPMLRSTLLLTLVFAGCGPRYVTNTEVEYTAEKQKVFDLVERYRLAIEGRDPDTIKSLTSKDYYENGSTTGDPSDDYDYNGLQSVLGDLKTVVKAVQLEMEVDGIEVLGDVATVDYQYKTQYMFTTGEQDKWATASDRNRITLRLEAGKWRIISGL